MAFGEARVNHSQQAPIGIERNELASVETDDLSSVGRDDGVVHPTRVGASDAGQICPVADHLVGGNVGGLSGIYGHHALLILTTHWLGREITTAAAAMWSR
jgi:hypothetical protein